MSGIAPLSHSGKHHPRHLAGTHRRGPAEGSLLGPLLAPSALAVADDGAVVGGILVTASPGELPFGGPWVVQPFRAPDAPGAGTALLRRALAIATRDGLPAVGLAVTDGNPAMRRYAELGFADVLETVGVQL